MGAWEVLAGIGAEVAADDMLSSFLKDPVVSYVGVTVAAAREPNPGVVVPLNGTRIRLPKWSAQEWEWWARLGLALAAKLKAATESDDDKRRIDRAAARCIVPVKHVTVEGDTSPRSVADLYNACVRLVIEAAATDFARRNQTGWLRLVREAVVESIVDIPQTIAEALGRSRDVIVDVARASAELLGKAFGAIARGVGSGLGISGGAALLLLAGLWWATRKSKE